MTHYYGNVMMATLLLWLFLQQKGSHFCSCLRLFWKPLHKNHKPNLIHNKQTKVICCGRIVNTLSILVTSLKLKSFLIRNFKFKSSFLARNLKLKSFFTRSFEFKFSFLARNFKLRSFLGRTLKLKSFLTGSFEFKSSFLTKSFKLKSLLISNLEFNSLWIQRSILPSMWNFLIEIRIQSDSNKLKRKKYYTS